MLEKRLGKLGAYKFSQKLNQTPERQVKGKNDTCQEHHGNAHDKRVLRKFFRLRPNRLLKDLRASFIEETPNGPDETENFRKHCLKWQGKKESNPHMRFWRPLFYH